MKLDEMTPCDKPERRRTYHFPDGKQFALLNVTHFHVRPSGTHRLRTQDGKYWIVPVGWLAIELDIGDWTA